MSESQNEVRRITVAHGDGIGPEIMAATLRVLEAAGAALEYETITIGKQVYERGFSSGIEDSAWDSLRRNKVFLKAPISTPQGGGVKSLNVTVRKSMGLFANVRPVVSYHPFVETRHPTMNVVIVRENEEDLYAGIEHRQTSEVTQCLKLISRPGTERIVRFAFEYARMYNRRKVTCFVKDNIMKVTDGLFSKVFYEIAEEYPDIEVERKIIDIGTALLADTPEQFDVIVTSNLYGDIISDVAAQIAGSVGLAGSANIGAEVAMFEAIHGSAPDIAGKNIANPSGLLQAAIMMLVQIGQTNVASRIENAWKRTLEDGIHTGDVFREGHSKRRVGTDQFANAVIERLGQTPESLRVAAYKAVDRTQVPLSQRPREEKELVGIDVFVDWSEGDRNPDQLAAWLQNAEADGLELTFITNRGVKVWPDGMPETFKADHWRCRFYGRREQGVPPMLLVALQQRLVEMNVDVIKTENLYYFSGEPGYSLGQGE